MNLRKALFGDGEPQGHQLSQDQLAELALGAHAAGNASVAANPDDPAHWMLHDSHVSIPVVHDDNCYICRDPEFAAMGLPLCYGCPACARSTALCTACGGRGGMADNTRCTDCLGQGYTGTLGHVAADDMQCSVCGEEDGPWNYDDEGLITGIPRDWAVAVHNMLHPKDPK